MFEHLARHRKILVTGPHRSGTTFTATAIAHDLPSHGLVREELLWNTRGMVGARAWLQEQPAPVVVQAPQFMDCCHQFPGVFVVVMMRRVEEIEDSMCNHFFLDNGKPASQRKVRMLEHQHYRPTYDVPLSYLKYESWHEQKEKMHPAMYLELLYDDLKEHPLWVDRAERRHFHVRQTA